MKNKLIFISSYPEKHEVHGKKTVGGASYSKNLVTNLKKTDKNIDLEVLAEIHDKKEKYKEGGIFVNRIWKRSSILSLIKLMSYVLRSRAFKIVIPLEFFMFGGLFHNILFLFMLFIYRFAGKKTTIILHQVIINLKIFYWPIIFLSEKIVVFEEKFRSVLNNKKVVFIPHAVEKARTIKKTKGKKFNSMYFGYFSSYKGIDFLINSWKKDYGQLTLVGGGNPNHMKNKKYSSSVKKLTIQANKKGVETTGFIPERKIADYFSKTNLVILPYRMFFSSSGPLSLSFSYEKPFILSQPMIGYFDSSDFQEALRETGLKKEDFIFDFNQKSFEYRLNWAKKNLDKLANFSRIMKEKRSWKKISKQYETLLK